MRCSSSGVTATRDTATTKVAGAGTPDSLPLRLCSRSSWRPPACCSVAVAAPRSKLPQSFDLRLRSRRGVRVRGGDAAGVVGSARRSYSRAVGGSLVGVVQSRCLHTPARPPSWPRRRRLWPSPRSATPRRDTVSAERRQRSAARAAVVSGRWSPRAALGRAGGTPSSSPQFPAARRVEYDCLLRDSVGTRVGVRVGLLPERSSFLR